LPIGPAIILVHVASTHIPFTSESKEAIADVPEIIGEVELALKDVARRLKNYLSRQDNLEKRREKEEIIYEILPRIAKKSRRKYLSAPRLILRHYCKNNEKCILPASC